MIATIKYDDHSGNFIITLEPNGQDQRDTLMTLMKEIQKYDENDAIEGRNATVYSEINQVIYGVTDDPEGRVGSPLSDDSAALMEIRIF